MMLATLCLPLAVLVLLYALQLLEEWALKDPSASGGRTQSWPPGAPGREPR
ncbi:hypothetical protein [Phycicoccus sp. 3266]|uniref:hypothetical protein n=1 Tax=Phycicoccus sp. 3266 TaxID=2817751 RepID=UPI002865C7CB|nr:hypothetical protein [Phycicoccus sp. 3266]MDR6862638.1 hypothetical protein [Phycicoccus sp. 3266]